MNIYVAECRVRWHRSNGRRREGLGDASNADAHAAVDVAN